MAPHTLIDLPPELLAVIVSYLQRPSTLKSLCLTCSCLRTAAQARLCHDVVLDLSKYSYPNLGDFFLPNNPAQTYVRKLTLESFNCIRNNAENTWKIVSLAVQLVSHDTLRELVLLGIHTVDLAILFQIYLSQKRLQRLQSGTAGKAMSEMFSSPVFSKEWMSSTRSICIPSVLDTLDDLDGYGQLIQMSDQLERLDLRTCKVRVAFGATAHTARLYDQAQNDGVLVRKLFGHIAPYGTDAALRLSWLNLSAVRLRYAPRTFMRVIDFTRLSHLSLTRCHDVATLLDALASLFQERGAGLRQCIFEGRGPDFVSLERFCRSFAGLRLLKLNFTAEPTVTSFDLRCLERHLATLQHLFLVIFDHKSRPTAFTHQQLKEVYGQANSLEFLSVSLAPVAISDAEHRRWGDFGASISALARLPQLQALRVLNLPSAPRNCFVDSDEEGSPSYDLNNLLYSQHLDGFTSRLYRHMATDLDTASPTRLPYLSFGSANEEVVDQEDSEDHIIMSEPVFYQTALQTSRMGRTEFVAVRTPDVEVAYELGVDRSSDEWF